MRQVENHQEEQRFDQAQYDFLKQCSDKGEEGIKKWNEWRKDHAQMPVLLEGANLSGVYLQDVDLRDAWLNGADLTDANAARSRLYRARLQNSVFRNANLEGAVFSQRHFESGSITAACRGRPRCQQYSPEQYEILARCSEEKDISEWNNWRASHPTEPVLLEGAQLASFHLEGARFDTGEFSDYDGQVGLHDVNLNDAHLEKARFHEAHMERANLWGA